MPEITRSSVVLPEPEGPSSATSSPSGMSTVTPASAGNSPNAFWTLSMLTRMGLPFEERLENDRDQRDADQDRRDRERGLVLEVVVEDLDVQRDGVRLAADVTGDDRDRAELADRARGAEDRAVRERPPHVRQRDPAERLPRRGAQRQRRELLLGAARLERRDQLARDERYGDERRREPDRGDREHDAWR